MLSKPEENAGLNSYRSPNALNAMIKLRNGANAFINRILNLIRPNQTFGARCCVVKWSLLAVLVLPALTLPASALTINLTYDSSVTNLSNAAQVEAAVATAAQTFQAMYTNAITVNITVYWGATGPFSGGIDLGASETQFIGLYTYSQLTNALRTARKSSADSNSVTSLPASSPIGTNLWWCPRAEAKAL